MRITALLLPFLGCALFAFKGTALPNGTKFLEKEGNVTKKAKASGVVLKTKLDNKKDEQKIVNLCARVHNNTAFIGVEPFSLALVASASECQRICMDSYPKCTAVVFYYIYGESKDHYCFLFDKNSVNENVTLVPEKPVNKKDIVRALEVAVDCHEFDPFPPLEEPFVVSTDKVSRERRGLGYDRPVLETGPWTPWSTCSVRSRSQVRSRACEYGRNIQKRQCTPRGGRSSIPSAYTQATHTPQIQYPPNPYVHPSSTSEEYARRMAEHQRQVEQTCCYRLQLQQQQQRQHGSQQGLQVHPAVPSASPCPTECPSSELEQDFRIPPTQFVTPPSTFSFPGPPRPANGGWTSWSQWSSCSVTCGSGIQQRSRTCAGEECPGEAYEQRPCDLRPCGLWAEWCEWTPCKATCGIGEKSRTRYCEMGTMRCEGSDYEVAKCDAGPCPEWSSWGEWSECSASCGGGIMRRFRTCTSGYCLGESVEQMPCALESCAYWCEWGPFTSCSVSCGAGGTMTRQRTCLGGDYCPGEPTETIPCTTPQPCPQWSEWEEWSVCSVSCGHGTLSRRRTCLGGYCEGLNVETIPCDLPPCSFWSHWQEWSPCSTTCGDGLKIRTRICQYGTECPGPDQESLFCAGPPCSAWTEWGEWSRCSADCGPGQKQRERQCLAADGSPSEGCLGFSVETVLCNERECCHWSEWCAWSNCDRDCGGGRMIRERFCQRPNSVEQFDDTCSCPGPDRDERECNTFPCAPQCQWTQWCPWSTCSSLDPCVAGLTTRSRQCVGEPGCNCYGFAEEKKSCHSDEPCTPPPPAPSPSPC